MRVYSALVGNVVAARRPWAWAIIALGFLLLARVAAPVGAMDLDTLVRVGAGTAVALVVIALGAATLSGWPLADSLRMRGARPPLRAIETVTLIVGLLALSHLLDAAIEHADLRATSRLGVIEDALAGIDGAGVWFALAGIALAPAIAEELLFRGYVLGALLSRLRPLWAVLISALLFGAAHFDLVQGGAAAILGVYLGAVSIATRSIRVCVAAHFCNNALAVLDPALAAPVATHPLVIAGGWALLASGGIGACIVLARRLRAPTPCAP